MVPDATSQSGKFVLTLDDGTNMKQGEFDFDLKDWQQGSRAEVEVIIDNGDKINLRTYLDGEPFEVAPPQQDVFDCVAKKSAPGEFEIFNDEEHQNLWKKMQKRQIQS